jgi:hypothetical protein
MSVTPAAASTSASMKVLPLASATGTPLEDLVTGVHVLTETKVDD